MAFRLGDFAICGLWSNCSESLLCPRHFRSMMVGGCTRGEGPLLPLRAQHAITTWLPDTMTLQMLLT
ncbi:MAG: hypothetical protein ABJQ63_10270, partial [Lentilitoribacter sp.]